MSCTIYYINITVYNNDRVGIVLQSSLLNKENVKNLYVLKQWSANYGLEAKFDLTTCFSK